MKKESISLWLDSYDDLFSDFDPRHLSERSLSDDFLSELKRAAADKSGAHLTLIFLLAKTRRKRPVESVIRGRLKAHFQRHFELLRASRRSMQKKGMLQGCVGLAVMLVIVLISGESKSIAARAVSLLAEAGGWFLFWSGMDKVFTEARQSAAELEFYAKMHTAEIEFRSRNPLEK